MWLGIRTFFIFSIRSSESCYAYLLTLHTYFTILYLPVSKRFFIPSRCPPEKRSMIGDRGSGIEDRESGIGDRGSRIGDRRWALGIGDRSCNARSILARSTLKGNRRICVTKFPNNAQTVSKLGKNRCGKLPLSQDKRHEVSQGSGLNAKKGHYAYQNRISKKSNSTQIAQQSSICQAKLGKAYAPNRVAAPTNIDRSYQKHTKSLQIET